MKHTIRQRVINQYGLPVVKVETVYGELGSKRFDKNGVEIDLLSKGKYDGEQSVRAWEIKAGATYSEDYFKNP